MFKIYFLRISLAECKFCDDWFDQKSRFINIIKTTPKDDYREMIVLSNFCSNQCATKNKNKDEIISEYSDG